MFTYRKEITPFMQRKKVQYFLYQTFAFLMVEPRGIDSIVVALRQAVAHVAHPRRIEFVRFHSDEYHTNKKTARRRSFYWWSRGESNPCPKVTWKELLRAQFVIYIPSAAREQTPSQPQ